MTDMTPTLPPLGPMPLPNIRGSGIPNLFTSEAMQSYATAYGEQCARAVVEAEIAQRGAPEPAAPRQLEAGAKKMAELFDYPWEHMPYEGRQKMRENVITVLQAIGGARAATPPAVAEQPMVDMVPPATARDRWMYEQGRLAERDPRTPPAVEARDGWVLVPKEPTPEMVEAARALFREERAHNDEVAVAGDTFFGPSGECYYRAMLSAAPAAPQEPKEPQRVTEAMIHKVGQAIWTASSGDFEPTKDEIRAICNAVLATQPPTQQASDDLIFQCGKAAGRQEVKDAQAQPDFRSWIQQAYRDPETTQFTIHNMEVAYQAGRESAPQQASAQGEQE